ncbi:hypothetical protein RKD37_003648 [Streptomyces ambofaciens]
MSVCMTRNWSRVPSRILPGTPAARAVTRCASSWASSSVHPAAAPLSNTTLPWRLHSRSR